MCCICISEIVDIVDIVEVVVLAATLITTICLYYREERRNRFYKLLDNWLYIKRNMALEVENAEGFDIVTETIVGENIFHYAKQEIEKIAKCIQSDEYKGKWEFKYIDEYKSLTYNLWQDVHAKAKTKAISVEEATEIESKYISDYKIQFTNYKYDINSNICGLSQHKNYDCVKEMSFFLFFNKYNKELHSYFASLETLLLLTSKIESHREEYEKVILASLTKSEVNLIELYALRYNTSKIAEFYSTNKKYMSL